jgi:hypothetical protein
MKLFALSARLVLLCVMITAWVSGMQTLVGAPPSTVAVTNTLPAIDTVSGALPATKDQYWAWAIAAVTPVITWAFGKIPMLPRPVLPVLTPFIGMFLGFILQKLDAAHLHWYSAAGAGTIAVFLRETTNQLVTKQLKPREESKTAAKPVDGAVAVHAATATAVQAADSRLTNRELEERALSGGAWKELPLNKPPPEPDKKA